MSLLADVGRLERFAEGYVEYLQELVDPDRRYITLMELLYRMEFEYSVPGDDNRESDGRNLRQRYAEFKGVECEEEWLEWPSSVLEMLIGLAYRIDDIMYDPMWGVRTREWFWVLMDNLKLTDYDDGYFWNHGKEAEECCIARVQNMMYREYGPNGEGGCLFPGTNRKDELWAQMTQWVSEHLEVENSLIF